MPFYIVVVAPQGAYEIDHTIKVEYMAIEDIPTYLEEALKRYEVGEIMRNVLMDDVRHMFERSAGTFAEVGIDDVLSIRVQAQKQYLVKVQWWPKQLSNAHAYTLQRTVAPLDLSQMYNEAMPSTWGVALTVDGVVRVAREIAGKLYSEEVTDGLDAEEVEQIDLDDNQRNILTRLGMKVVGHVSIERDGLSQSGTFVYSASPI